MYFFFHKLNSSNSTVKRARAPSFSEIVLVHFLFRKLNSSNFMVKRAWLGEVLDAQF